MSTTAVEPQVTTDTVTTDHINSRKPAVSEVAANKKNRPYGHLERCIGGSDLQALGLDDPVYLGTVTSVDPHHS